MVADVVQRGRGELPRRRASRASTRRSTGPASARCAPPSWCCAGCCRWPTRGWRPGASPADDGDRLLGIIEQRCLIGTNGAEWFVDRMAARRDLDRYDALRATLAGVPRAHAHQRARCTPGSEPGRLPLPQPLPDAARAAARVAPAVRGHHDEGEVEPRPRRTRPRRPRASRRRRPAGSGSPAGPARPRRRVAGRVAAQQRGDDVGPQRRGRRSSSRLRRSARAARVAHVQHGAGSRRRSVGAHVREDRPAQRRGPAPRRRVRSERARPRSLPDERRRAALVHRYRRSRGLGTVPAESAGSTGLGAGGRRWERSWSGYVRQAGGRGRTGSGDRGGQAPRQQARRGQLPPGR